VTGRIGVQLKPSKWPLRIRSPMGDGARRGFAGSMRVAERRGRESREKGMVLAVGETAVLGGGLGGDTERFIGPSFGGFTKAPLLKESLRKRAVPRSTCVPGRGWVCG